MESLPNSKGEVRTMQAASGSSETFRVIEGGAQDALIGRVIDGRYEVERVLGEGGMGLVYRGRHTLLNKTLAIKVLRPEVSRDEEIIGRFRQEAQSASSIGNQHIIDISDFGTLPDGSTYFIMEYLDGTDLTKLIETCSPLPANRIVHIAKQLCDALSAAHEAGIVHRDLKPDNIYLVRRGSESDFVKVLDFGIAKVGGASSKLTRAGQVFGTPHYMSPEQCGGAGVDHRTDIYAIGTILYEMVVGRTPFDADNLMGILTKHLFEAPVPPTHLRPDCPSELESVIMRCIAKKQDERYANCRELLADLERVQQGMPALASAMTYSAVPTMPVAASPSGHVSSPRMEAPTLPAPAPKAAPRNVVPWAVLGVVSLLSLGGIGAYVASTHEAARSSPHGQVAQIPQIPQMPRIGRAEVPTNVPTVRLVTDPVGAEIWSSQELLGQTPLDIPRPSGTDHLDVEIRATGYAPRQVSLSSHTLASELRFALTAERTSTHRVGGSTRVGPRTDPGTMTEISPMTHESPDVIDPWATPRSH